MMTPQIKTYRKLASEQPAVLPVLPGVNSFMREMYRVSYAPGLTQWCTPGHNRGAALGSNLTAEYKPAPDHPVRSPQ